MGVIQIDNIAFMQLRILILLKPLDTFFPEGTPGKRLDKQPAQRVLRQLERFKHLHKQGIFARQFCHLRDGRAARG